MLGRRKLAAIAAEFLGTGALTLVFLSVQRSTIGVPFFVAMAAGLVAAMLVTVFGSTSGAHINPAVTLALWTARKIDALRAVLYIAAQLLGAWAAYGLYTYFVNSSLQPLKSTFSGRVLVAEAVGAFVLALAWAAVTFRANLTSGARAALIGVGYMLGVVVAAVAGIGIINPAVAEGIRAWDVFSTAASWGTYVLGPVLGAIIGINLYGLLFAGDEVVEDYADPVLEEVETVSVVSAAAVKPLRKVAKKPVAKKAPAKKRTAKK